MRSSLGVRLAIAAVVVSVWAVTAEAAKATPSIRDMTCDGCAAGVKAQLQKTEGVTGYDVSVEGGEARVRHDPARTDPQAITASVSRTPFQASAKGERRPVAERTSVFRVLLACKAAPEMVCAGQTKPVLIKLERALGIEEAWLNTSGTALVVIGTRNSTGATRAEAVRAAVGSLGKDVEELKGEARDTILADFRSGAGWHRSEGSDDLSRRIAMIVAARLVRRTRESSSIRPAKAAELEAAVSHLLQISFVRDPRGDPSADLLKVGRAHLDGREFLAFREAVAGGLDPKPGEK